VRRGDEDGAGGDGDSEEEEEEEEEERVGLLLLSCRDSAGVYPLVFNVWANNFQVLEIN
jgi:hypothetical protein